MRFSNPQAILFVADCERAARFYGAFGFVETFRLPETAPVKIEMELDGFSLGLALPGPAAESHGLDPVTSGHRACMTFWTDDIEAGYRLALETGAVDLAAPHPFLDGKLLIAILEDPDGHPVQLVQRRDAQDAAVGLPRRFSNTRPALVTLIRRVLGGSEARSPRSRESERSDSRGPVTKNRAQPQTRLRPSKRAELVADYEAGMPVKALCEKYGVHRSTIPVLVRRAGVDVRGARLDAERRKRASSLEESEMTLVHVALQMGDGNGTGARSGAR